MKQIFDTVWNAQPHQIVSWLTTGVLAMVIVYFLAVLVMYLFFKRMK